MQVPDPGAWAEVIIPIAGMLTGGALIVTVGWTVRHWVDRHYGRARLGGDDVVDVLDRIDQRLANVESLAERVQDLEERLDFTERVLAQAKERPALQAHEDA